MGNEKGTKFRVLINQGTRVVVHRKSFLTTNGILLDQETKKFNIVVLLFQDPILKKTKFFA